MASLAHFLTIVIVVAAVSVSVSGEDTLFAGESLNSNEFIENGRFRLIMQTDCNLMLYVDRTRAVWASNTVGRGTSCRASLLNDGRLVIVSGTTQLWASGSALAPNNYRLIMQADGNAVIYGAPVWATNTVQN